MIIGWLMVVSLIFPNVLADLDNYGDYDVCIESLEQVFDKKAANLSKLDIRIDHNEDGDQLMSVNLTIFEENGPFMYKLRAYKWNGKRFESLITFSSPNICDNILQIKFYSKFVNIIDHKKCIVEKGLKMVKDISFKDFISPILGARAFYGKFKAQLLYYGKKGNIAHVVAIASFVKKGTCQK